MSVWWLVILLIYGGIYGFGTIGGLWWLLLLVFLVQDSYDILKGRK